MVDSIKVIKDEYFLELYFKDKCMCLIAKHKEWLILSFDVYASESPSNLIFSYK